MLVREVMSVDPVTVRVGTTVQAALLLLAEAQVTSLPVVTSDGRVRGIVSEVDLIRDRVGHDPRLHEILEDLPALDRAHLVDEVMTPHTFTVRPETDLADAIELFTTTGVKSAPVVDRHERVLGMLSRSDVVRVLAHTDVDLEREVDAALTSVGLTDWFVEANDGSVVLTGPSDEKNRSLARIAAAGVPGVCDVRIRAT